MFISFPSHYFYGYFLQVGAVEGRTASESNFKDEKDQRKSDSEDQNGYDSDTHSPSEAAADVLFQPQQWTVPEFLRWVFATLPFSQLLLRFLSRLKPSLSEASPFI